MSDLERDLGDAIADGKVSEDDADVIREFGEFLGKLPAPWRLHLPEGQAEMRHALLEHAEFCGLSQEDVDRLREAEGLTSDSLETKMGEPEESSRGEP